MPELTYKAGGTNELRGNSGKSGTIWERHAMKPSLPHESTEIGGESCGDLSRNRRLSIPHVTHLNYKAGMGGASAAAYRIMVATRDAGLSTDMIASRGFHDDNDVRVVPRRRTLARLFQKSVNRIMSNRYRRRHPHTIPSFGIADSGLASRLNAMPSRILHMHWVAGDMLSIREIGKLRHPLVWTLHDMWPFCGAAHFEDGGSWQSGYSGESDDSLDRKTWELKVRNWRREIFLVAPSTWLASCVGKSPLMRDWPVAVIPNPIDTTVWRPSSMTEARAELGVDQDSRVVAFGAIRADRDPRKGMDLVIEALRVLQDSGSKIELLIFGSDGEALEKSLLSHCKIRALGTISDKQHLQRAYVAADVVVIPSRQDNLPNIGVEALACGTPLVGFRVGGMSDLVPASDIGCLVEPFDTRALAAGIGRVLDSQHVHRETPGGAPMGRAARSHAEAMFGNRVVAEKYSAVYESVAETLS